METLRKRLEISHNKATKTSIVLLITMMMLSPFYGHSQDSAIRQIRENDENGTPRLRKVEFWDTQKNMRLKTIDLINDNPFNSMGWKIRGNNFEFREYELNGKKVSDFVPQEILAGYNPEMRNPGMLILGAFVNYDISFDKPDFLLINYYTHFLFDETQGGELNCLVLLNKNGEKIKSFPKYDRNAPDLGISNNGRYIAHIFSGEGVGDPLYPSGFRILDLENNKYFQLEIEGFKKPLITGSEAYLYCQRYVSSQNNYEVDLFRFDMEKGNYFHHTLTYANEEQKRVAFGNSDIITFIEKYYKDRSSFEEQPLVWKDMESYWK